MDRDFVGIFSHNNDWCNPNRVNTQTIKSQASEHQGEETKNFRGEFRG